MFSNLSPHLAGVFLKMGSNWGNLRKGVEDVVTFKGGAHFIRNMKAPANTSFNRNIMETLAGFDSVPAIARKHQLDSYARFIDATLDLSHSCSTTLKHIH